uniref:proline-rich protein 2-like n=1 Tax=Nyctereutes procyonoides TaxID=34880 RepID=UPI0024452F66|nr:proline-rich protein 2-like [Nyctereutes procyonoides]
MVTLTSPRQPTVTLTHDTHTLSAWPRHPQPVSLSCDLCPGFRSHARHGPHTGVLPPSTTAPLRCQVRFSVLRIQPDSRGLKPLPKGAPVLPEDRHLSKEHKQMLPPPPPGPPPAEWKGSRRLGQRSLPPLQRTNHGAAGSPGPGAQGGSPSWGPTGPERRAQHEATRPPTFPRALGHDENPKQLPERSQSPTEGPAASPPTAAPSPSPEPAGTSQVCHRAKWRPPAPFPTGTGLGPRTPGPEQLCCGPDPWAPQRLGGRSAPRETALRGPTPPAGLQPRNAGRPEPPGGEREGGAGGPRFLPGAQTPRLGRRLDGAAQGQQGPRWVTPPPRASPQPGHSAKCPWPPRAAATHIPEGVVRPHCSTKTIIGCTRGLSS